MVLDLEPAGNQFTRTGFTGALAIGMTTTFCLVSTEAVGLPFQVRAHGGSGDSMLTAISVSPSPLDV